MNEEAGEVTTPLAPEDAEFWSAVGGVAAGDLYRFRIGGSDPANRNDPYAAEVTWLPDGAWSVVTTSEFDWGASPYGTPTWDGWVIYELHAGTFNDQPGGAPGGFDTVEARLDYLRDLGVSVIELMPSMEFSGDFSWGYNPAQPFAIEGAYGGPDRLKALIRAAHERGLAVLLDVVYNHLGPQDLDLWRFDGWHEGDGGGIYFYNDDRRKTPWGDTRPDYGRPQVRRYLLDNARMWLEDFRADGLRWDATAQIRSRNGTNEPWAEIPDGWLLLQEITSDTASRQPWKLHIAEDLQGNDGITKPAADGGAGFGAQWDAGFVHPIRQALTTPDDPARDLQSVIGAISSAGTRQVIYTESHDEVANGHARLPEEISPGHAGDYYARKRSTLGAALVFTTPGMPMTFQGQEILEDQWWHDDDPIDWTKADAFAGILNMYRDLIALRRDRRGKTRGLRGQGLNISQVNDTEKVLAFHRWHVGGPRDDVMVLSNFSAQGRHDYRIGMPRSGTWRLRCNTDWVGYSDDFGQFDVFDTITEDCAYDDLPVSATFAIPSYTALVYSQDD